MLRFAPMCPAVEFPTHRWTVAGFMQAANADAFDNKRVELVDGEVRDVPPQDPPHATTLELIKDQLRTAYPATEFCVRVQLPLVCEESSMPEPDLVVVRGTPRDFALRHPCAEEVLLVVEVSFSSQGYDRLKSKVYARTGVREYWIVDVKRREVEVNAEPKRDGTWQARWVLSSQGQIRLPGRTTVLQVADILI